MVTVNGSQVSTSFAITDPPVAPVIIDNLYPRTGGGSSGTMFTYDLTLPNTPCARCTIQVLQMMVGHGPPNYIYHHCADIEIVADTPPDAGFVDAEIDAGTLDANVIDTGPVIDTGVADTGAVEDAGVIEDAGFVDAGAIEDSGEVIGRDAATIGDARTGASLRDEVRGSCGCNTFDRARGSAFWVAVPLVLLCMRRSRRATSTTTA
jgi:hypothetical protein